MTKTSSPKKTEIAEIEEQIRVEKTTSTQKVRNLRAHLKTLKRSFLLERTAFYASKRKK